LNKLTTNQPTQQEDTMHKKIAELWVADLRNPENKQGKRALGDSTNGYCCLGRLCVVLNVPFHSHDCFLPTQAARLSGMKSNDGYFWDVEVDLLYRRLTDMNDGNRGPQKTFPEIADFIEQHWEDL
jgi:hypothetical protein